MTVDRELVTRKILLILRDLDSVRPFAGRRLDDYLQNIYDQAVVERHLERMVGRMIDINCGSERCRYHLITGAGEAPPADYSEITIAPRVKRAGHRRAELEEEPHPVPPGNFGERRGSHAAIIGVTLRDVRMIERGEQLRLAFEAHEAIPVGCQCGAGP